MRTQKVVKHVWWFLMAWLLGVVVLAAAPLAVHGAAQPTVAAQDEFVPLDAIPPDEQLPAAPLVLTAYAAAWLIAIGYLWSIWQRLGRVEREIQDVSRRVEQRSPAEPR